MDDVTILRVDASPIQKVYAADKVFWIRLAYVVLALVWILIVLVLRLHIIHPVCLIILAIPLLVFTVNFWTAEYITMTDEESVYQANYLAVGLIIVLPLFTWLNGNHNGDKKRYGGIVVTAIVLMLLAMIDLYLPREWLSIIRHIQSACQAMALTLLIYALASFFLDSVDDGGLFCNKATIPVAGLAEA